MQKLRAVEAVPLFIRVLLRAHRALQRHRLAVQLLSGLTMIITTTLRHQTSRILSTIDVVVVY